MIRKLALLFVFLATFSVVYAFPYHLNKRAATFGYCQGASQDLAIISNVKLSPNPPKVGSNLKVKGSATTNTNIVDGDSFIFAIVDAVTDDTLFLGPFVDICSKTTCPTTTINFGEHYNLKLNVTSLPAKYNVGVLIGTGLSKIKACGEAHFPE
ncbi:5230_t:CDS:1 [Cetraspora pellucida]|uniref:5230_t:CDS:1 n=1 Tax=Cetraspora pellucida TaxID=1433469 RepID=A0ACA9LJ41_9GLOM|nr:5230_t:CDS:1 [Cetraspora pellucida]